MKIPTGIGAVWLIGASLSAIVWARPAAAQAQAAADYELPAQDLGQTLRAIAQASGQDILFPAGLVQGRTAPAIKGRLTLDEALRRALAGSGLVVDHQAGAVLIRAPAAVDAPTPAGRRSEFDHRDGNPDPRSRIGIAGDRQQPPLARGSGDHRPWPGANPRRTIPAGRTLVWPASGSRAARATSTIRRH